MLVVKAYPTALFANQADHTYVECRSGTKGWKCWGGKTGGRVIGSGSASTIRANDIARPDEKAGLKCYLVNGVCHQAANRILIEAKITVRQARGASLSTALFGTYGRVLAQPCASPFNTYPAVSGDLPECAGEEALLGVVGQDIDNPERIKEAAYVESVLSMYAKAEAAGVEGLVEDNRNFQIDIFLEFARYQLEDRYENVRSNIREIKDAAEEQLEGIQKLFGDNKSGPREYVAAFEQYTMDFQSRMASALSAPDYRALFALHPGERVSLVDPQIVQEVYGV